MKHLIKGVFRKIITRNMIPFISLVAAVLVSVLSLTWLASNPGYEPLIGLVGGLSGIAGSEFLHEKLFRRRRKKLKLEATIDRYNRLRSKDPVSIVRDAKMTKCVNDFIETYSDYELESVTDWLISHDNGKRLACYAYLFVNPSETHYESLLKQVLHDEDIPFNFYWGLLAIRQIIGECNCDANSSKLEEPLKRCRERKIGGGADIQHLVGQLEKLAKP